MKTMNDLKEKILRILKKYEKVCFRHLETYLKYPHSKIKPAINQLIDEGKIIKFLKDSNKPISRMNKYFLKLKSS